METQTQNIKKLKEEKKKLKEENKKLKQADQRRDKEWEVSEVCQMRCIQKLKEENEKLKEMYEELHGDFSANANHYDYMLGENEKLKEIIKKALDYPNGFVGLGTVSAEELRDILMDPEED
jgi:hypothetical protein